MKTTFQKYLLLSTILIFIFTSCNSRKGNLEKEEQIRIEITEEEDETPQTPDSIAIQGNIAFSQLPTAPNAVILTGLPDHRLVSVYKAKTEKEEGRSFSFSKFASDYDGEENDQYSHFMPGIDILYGYNLLNIAHYDMKQEKLNFLFSKAALIKTLYYPSYEQDSLDKKPISRDYYLVSVYDQDTNKDTLINKKDLRRFYHFNAANTVKTQLIPSDYSVVRSQYDPKNDAMFIFASHDADKNGTADKKEPVHIFWINLKAPAVAKRLY